MAEPEIIFEEQGRSGVATLNRADERNALTPGMINGLEAYHLKWAKAPKTYGLLLLANGETFCAGHDWSAILQNPRAGALDPALNYFRDAHQHCWTLESFTKPNVALLDAALDGAGLGICLYGTHRVAGERFSCRLTERNGFFPGMGLSYVLSQMPGRMGMHLALSGESLVASDAFSLKLVTHCIPAADFGKIREALVDGEPIDPFLDGLHRDPGGSEIMRRRSTIDDCFRGESVNEILRRLETGDAWAKETAASLRQRSPHSLQLAFKLLSQPAETLKDALQREYHVIANLLRAPELWERFSGGAGTDATMEDAARDLEPILNGEAEVELTLKDHWTLIEI
jgi:enoyl-CoA hydratase